eukprot:scaffold6825_cov50-Cylindrotheca_fusiformis.AAC.1
MFLTLSSVDCSNDSFNNTASLVAWFVRCQTSGRGQKQIRIRNAPIPFTVLAPRSQQMTCTIRFVESQGRSTIFPTYPETNCFLFLHPIPPHALQANGSPEPLLSTISSDVHSNHSRKLIVSICNIIPAGILVHEEYRCAVLDTPYTN